MGRRVHLPVACAEAVDSCAASVSGVRSGASALGMIIFLCAHVARAVEVVSRHCCLFSGLKQRAYVAFTDRFVYKSL